MKNKKFSKRIKLFIASVIALAIWQGVAMKIDQNIILASPIDVGKRLVSLLGEKEFLPAALFSFRRIVFGFLLGTFCGTVLAIIAGRVENIEILLKPFMSTVKAVPVASFVVLSLLWFGSENLSSFISFLMVLPIIYTNVLQGIKSLDSKMMDMAKVFRFSFFVRLKYLWLPSVKPFLISGSAVAAGLAWKSGVAAEIIGIPDGSVGEILFESKVYLDTETLLAWTVIIVALSIGTEKLFALAIKGLFALFAFSPFPKNAAGGQSEKAGCTVKMLNVSKSFGGDKVINNFSAEFSSGVTALVGKSGCGKTTIVNMILGLETQDSGEIIGVPEKTSAIFQENRLSEEFSPLGNVVAVTEKKKSGEEILSLLSELGIDRKDSLKKKSRKLSGGMKRRVAICRALCAEGDLIIMDEPFSGLDEKTKTTVIETVKKHIEGKTVILITHDLKEAERMGAYQVLSVEPRE